LNRVCRVVSLWVVTLFLCMWPARAFAQADEIQVYDGSLAPKGIFNLTIHSNFTPKGITTPAFPGGVTPDKSFNGVPEWALGVTRWFEAGLYLPLYTYDKDLGWGVNGAKLRALFAVPDAETRKFFYGANFEFSYNANRWDTTNFTSEIRPIVGWHLGKTDVIVNPILDTAYDGLKNLEFVPAFRVAYNPSDRWAVAVEEYADFGPVSQFHAAQDQSHQIYGVVNFTGRVEVEAGVGFGLTDASDSCTLKLIVAFDLNRKKTVK